MVDSTLSHWKCSASVQWVLLFVRSSARAATLLSFPTTRMVKLIFTLPQVTLLRLTASVGTPVALARFSLKMSCAVSLLMKSEQFSANVISKFICHAPPGVSGGGDGGGGEGGGGDGGGGEGGGGEGGGGEGAGGACSGTGQSHPVDIHCVLSACPPSPQTN